MNASKIATAIEHVDFKTGKLIYFGSHEEYVRHISETADLTIREQADLYKRAMASIIKTT